MAPVDSNDFKLHDNALGHHSNDLVNGWHLHSNEQVSSDNITGMTYYKLNEQMPNYGMNCFCYPVSSELLSINTQKSFDISNSCDHSAITPSDPFPGLPTTSSEAVLEVDVAEHNGIFSLEGTSHSQAHSKNDVVNTISLAKLSDPADAHYGLEGCYNPVQGKPKRSPRKSVKKSKSFYNNCNNSWKNCGQRLNFDAETAKQNNVRTKSEINSGNVISNGFSVQSCSQLSSHPKLCHNVNTAENSRSENSDGKRESESSGNEDGVLTSGVTSTGHESTTIDQTWDGYQVNLQSSVVFILQLFTKKGTKLKKLNICSCWTNMMSARIIFSFGAFDMFLKEPIYYVL